MSISNRNQVIAKTQRIIGQTIDSLVKEVLGEFKTSGK